MAFREFIGDARALVGEDDAAPEVVSVNTWQALTRYSEANDRDPSYIVYDYQTANRLSYLCRQRLFGDGSFDSFDTFLNHVAVFWELCVVAGRFDRVKRVKDRFDAIKPGLARRMILATLQSKKTEEMSQEKRVQHEFAFDVFLQGFLLGHEIGHYLFPGFQERSPNAKDFHDSHFAFTHKEMNGQYSKVNGFFDGEFVFRMRQVISLRAYRGGSDNMMGGVLRRVEREQKRREFQENQEFYCDVVGLTLGLQAANECGMLGRLPVYWMCLYMALMSQTFLRYLAYEWMPVSSGVVPFVIPPLFERFALPIRLIGETPGFDGLLPRLGWEAGGLKVVANGMRMFSEQFEESAEALAGAVRDSVIYEIMRAYNGPEAAGGVVDDIGSWRATEELDYEDLFLSIAERSTDVPDSTFGGQMAYRFILEALTEEWREDGRSTVAGDLSEKDRLEMREQVINFRADWRRYVRHTVDQYRRVPGA